MREKFFEYIVENNLVSDGEGVVVGLSGGPDSVCLLNLLCSLRQDMNLKIAAAHVNHMLRAEDADKDEEYARNLCKKFKVEFFCKRVDINKYSKDKGLSSETAGREVRYAFFDNVMERLNFSKIATAHNSNDQAETVLMRIMRGTGLEGLTGIPVKRDEKYIRPILFMERKDIEGYCKRCGLEPCIDETNNERLYRRNKVRLDILPYMKKNFNDDIITTINRMVLLLQEDNKYIMGQVDKYFIENCVKHKDEVIIYKSAFECDNAIINRIIRRAIKEVGGNKYDVEMKHIKEVISLKNMETNKKIDLPNGIYAQNIYGNIFIRIKVKNNKKKYKELVLAKEDILHKEVCFQNYIFTFEVIAFEENIDFIKNKEIKYFNYDSINGNIIIRQRKEGDKIIPLGMTGSKKIKDIFINMKIPQEDREFIPIIQFGEDIAWIVPIKLSDKYKITDETKNILKIVVRRR
ncbi:tRNA lysidine(34) synthetase TilS [Clostridium vincentii]|uniref:tRNA lysidine(34) synthetase TilS n=1 Tax=Clostridium vincentii TaxID=52704 RepID=UPI003BFA6E5F